MTEIIFDLKQFREWLEGFSEYDDYCKYEKWTTYEISADGNVEEVRKIQDRNGERILREVELKGEIKEDE